MFSLFTRKHYVVDSGILRGMTDIHCHLLPGVDDGSPDIKHTMALLSLMEEVGIKQVWFTPHVMQDMGNTAAKLTARFDEFKPQYNGPIQLHLASEYMMDQGFRERLHTDPLRLGKEHLLVETSYINPPVGLHDILLDVWQTGFKPLIAHPERYVYMDEADYLELKEKGYDFQLNLMSLSGYYGERAKVVGTKLLEAGMYNYVGSDLHHLHHYEPMLFDFRLKKKHLDALAELIANNENI